MINPLNPRLYLASRSPRRCELLTQIGVQFDTIVFRDPPREDKELDETPHDGEAALAYVERVARSKACLLYTSPSPRDRTRSRMPSSA